MADEKTLTTEAAEAATKEPDYKALYEEAQKEGERLKNALNKTSSEVAKYKKDLADRMTEQERVEAERKAAEEEKDRKLAEYAERERISSYQAKIMSAGYDGDTALIMAKALPAGVADTYFDELKKHNEGIKSSALAEALKQQPKLTPGAVPNGTNPELEAMLRGAGLK